VPDTPRSSTVALSCPGKLILLGEHAAVYHRPALVAAIDLRLHARFTRRDSPRVMLDLTDLGHREETPWPEVLAYGAAARERWAAYDERPGPERFGALRGDDPAHVAKVALAEAAEHLVRLGIALPGLALAVRSDLPIGSGFGSSAALGAAAVAGLLRLADAGTGLPETAAIEEIALRAERLQHGHPSGVDTATALAGGVLWARRTPGGILEREPVAVRSPLLGRLRVFDTGMPPEPTGAVVAGVRAFRERHPGCAEALLDRLEAAAMALRRELESADDDPDAARDLLRESAACLAELGVVPEPVRRIVGAVEAAGGAAKISGAGSLAGPGAGCLLVYHSDAGRIADLPELGGLRPLPLRLGAAGFRFEDLAAC
jgi:mevalonate kinase